MNFFARLVKLSVNINSGVFYSLDMIVYRFCYIISAFQVITGFNKCCFEFTFSKMIIGIHR